MKKIVIDDAVPYAEEIFSHLGEVKCIPGKAIDRQSVKNADAVIIRSRTQINQKLLNDTSVTFVGSTVVGLDHIDQPYLEQQGIEFYSAQGCNANSVSEYVITCLVNLAQSHGFELCDRSLGIIGVGHVGRLLEQKAKVLGMTVLLNDPPRQESEGQKEFVTLDEALQADIISFHTPLTYDGDHPTHHLLNQKNFHHITSDTILVNAARGGIIDESLWAQTPTLANVIDCWENEPNINPKLYQVADIATPHIAGHALEAKIKGSAMVYQALCEFWGVKPKDTWKSNLPERPEIIRPTDTLSFQTMLFNILKQCYRPEEDDAALRESTQKKDSANNIDNVYKKFEYYRRHYPIHREWTEHRLYSTNNATFDQGLSALGFKVTNT